MRGVTFIALLALFAQAHAEEVAANDMTNSMDDFVDKLVDKLADNTDDNTEEGEEGEENDETEETEEGDENDETEEGDENDETDLTDMLMDKLTDKLIDFGLNDQLDEDEPMEVGEAQDDDELDDDELVEVLGLRGGAAMKAMKAMAAMKAMKAMGAMKAMKAMKTMKAMKAMKVSKIAKSKRAKAVVFHGTKAKTTGGLTKSDLVKNKRGLIVSKKQQAKGKALYTKYGSKWMSAVAQARKALGVKGFVAIKKGTPLYTKAKSLFR